MKLKKLFINILCLFVPSKKWRHKLRSQNIRYSNGNKITIITESGEKVENPFAVAGLTVKFRGSDNHIEIREPFKISGSVIKLADNSSLTIGSGAELRDFYLHDWYSANNKISIGRNFFCTGRLDMSPRANTNISIGDNCLFAGGLRIKTSDDHDILDVRSKTIINKPHDVSIGNHVWIGMDVMLLKMLKYPTTASWALVPSWQKPSTIAM